MCVYNVHKVLCYLPQNLEVCLLSQALSYLEDLSSQRFVINKKMVDFYQICLCCVSGFHIVFDLGNLFKLPPLYDFSNFLVNGKPGTGSTQIENVFEFIFGLWYTGSIAWLFLTFFISAGSSAALHGSLF